METIGNRLEKIREELWGKSSRSFATSLGISASTWRNYEKGISTPSFDNILDICQKLSISADWLLFGTGSMRANESEEVSSANPEEFTAVPKVEAKLAAGGGSFMTSDRIVEYFDFRTDWLRTKGSIKDMVLMDVSGDSMEPEIHDRDMVLIDQSKKNLMPGRIYAMGIEDAIYVKYFDTAPGKIILRSENKEYSPIVIDTSEDLDNQFRVIGRVLWVCREY